MFEQLKETKELLKDINENKETVKDENGCAVIKISVNNDNNFLSDFSHRDEPIISSETAEYIDHSIKHLKPRTKLHFVFSGDSIDEDEKPIYISAIHNYYHSEFIEVVREIRKNRSLTFVMAITAAMIFALALILQNNGTEAVILNMLDVTAWVFMWEAVDIFAFRTSLLKIRRMRYLRIIKSEISFE